MTESAQKQNMKREQTMQARRTYLAIDLKSFYASVECRERGLDPLTTNLVVADVSRTEKTICLAVSPSLKQYGIPGRARLFEVIARLREVNAERAGKAPGRKLTGESYDDGELQRDTTLAVSYVAAVPRMALYMEYSTRIYQIYLRYIAPEDIHVYSIDEVLIDATGYLRTYGMTPHELARRMIADVQAETGITATAGIGTNLYLAKVAMDIVAKHIPADEDGVRIAELDEMSYQRLLWSHRPLTDFWRVGRGYAAKLEAHGLYTMGDIARCSLGKETDYLNEDLLFRLFGINAELLIDHAWGIEPCTIAQIKAYKPESSSISQGQVLMCPYDAVKAKIVVREMTEFMTLDLVEKNLMTDQIVLTIVYEAEHRKGSLDGGEKSSAMNGAVKPAVNKAVNFAMNGAVNRAVQQDAASDHEITTDWYGRKAPKPAHGSANLERYTSSSRLIIDAMMALYDRIVDFRLPVRRIYVVANHVLPEQEARAAEEKKAAFEQLDLFTDYSARDRKRQEEDKKLQKEKALQNAMLDIKKKFGKNAILKGTSMEEGATGRERNETIGGHRA